VAQVETPWPISVRSDGRPSSRADAPVARISVFAVYSASAGLDRDRLAAQSTLVTLPCMISVPNFSACARISAIRSGP
jgi:hypothetical protein